jgi:hypothetical protein
MSELSCHRRVLLMCKEDRAVGRHDLASMIGAKMRLRQAIVDRNRRIDAVRNNQGGLQIASLSLMTIVLFPESGSRSVTIS